ncbi:MAG: right-handed parallel beta-helix repeat-containing protein [Pirellulaceae bacterium]
MNLAIRRYVITCLVLNCLAVSNLPTLRGQDVIDVSQVDIRSFGAVGDGRTDDTNAFRKAISSGRGGIRLGNGTFRITETVDIELDKVGFTSLLGDGTARVIMAGAGPAFRLIGTHGGTADPGTVQPSVWDRQRAPLIEGIEIVGAHKLACGIEARGTMQLIINRVVIRKVLHGIHLTKRNRNVIIAMCHIYENEGVGIYYDHVDLHQSNITNSHISYNRQGGIVLRGGNVRNVHIGVCDIEGNMSPKTEPTANILIDSTGGSLGEIAITGCTIQHDHRSPGSANIRINGKSLRRSHTNELRHGNITISANVLSDVRTNIEASNTRGLTIVGNTIWKGFDSNLVLDNCQSFVVLGNIFDRNPRYHYGDGADAKLGVVLRNCTDGNVTGNAIHGTGDIPAAIYLKNCKGINMTGNSVYQPRGAAFLLEGVRSSRVSGSLIRVTDARQVIVQRNSGPNQIANNLIDRESE